MYTLEFVVIMCRCYPEIRLDAILNSYTDLKSIVLGNKVNTLEQYVVALFYTPSRGIKLIQQAEVNLNFKDLLFYTPCIHTLYQLIASCSCLEIITHT